MTQLRVQARQCFPGEVSIYWKMHFQVKEKKKFRSHRSPNTFVCMQPPTAAQHSHCSWHLLCLWMCTQILSMHGLTHLVVDKVLGLESIQLQEVSEQGDVPILDCIMKNCLVAFHILFKNRKIKQNKKCSAEQLADII